MQAAKRSKWRDIQTPSVVQATWPALVQSLAVVLVLDASTLQRIMGKSWRIWSFLALLALDVVRGHLHISEDYGDALQAVGFSGVVGAGRGEDALGSHVLEFENSLVAAAEVTCDVPAQTEISDDSSAFHAETVHCWSPCQCASFNSTTDCFSWGHDPCTLAC